MSKRNGGFVWYELMTSDLDAAEAFYRKVLGWSLADAGVPGLTYRIANVGQAPVGGLMPIPPEAAESGAQPAWYGYVGVPDVDDFAETVKARGGAIHREPCDIPGVGRFAIAADPQGAVFVPFRGNAAPSEPPPYMTPGTFGWHELHTKDWASAFDFYAGLFDWRKGPPIDMGPMGTYQLIGGEDGDFGAMFNNDHVPRPFWLYYVSVDDIDTAHSRVAGAGGTVIFGPSAVPGDMWILQVRDPQGAMIALVGPRAKTQ